MPASVTDEGTLTIKFGGGVNSASSEDDVQERECSVGQNFILDLKNRNLRPRPAITKLGTAPNGSQIRGFANMIDADGNPSILVQAGSTVYRWASSLGFIAVGSVSASSRLRGPLSQYWPLDDLVIITDLNLSGPVLVWDGSALTTMTHNLGGSFRAKYCWIDNERARFSNVVSGATATPHMVVTSKLSDYQTLSVSDRPSSALGKDDPYYLLTPDLRPINGMAGFYNSIVISSKEGSLYKVSGSDSTDTEIVPYYQRSFATGDESIAFVGNDIAYGRTGRIESFAATQNYGDVATNDISSQIKDQIIDLYDWTIAYNSRTQKMYVHPAGAEFILQYSKDVSDGNLSPWVKLVTANTFSMNVTAMMTMIDPDDNLEYTFMGDTEGNLYRIEGEIGEQDSGSNDITTTWRSGLFKLNAQQIAQDFRGYISYRSGQDTQVTIKLLHAGSYVSDATCVVNLRGSTGGEYFGEDIYFGGDVYFGTPFEGRFRREEFDPEGGSEEVQVEISHTGYVDFEINEIGFSFASKTNP